MNVPSRLGPFAAETLRSRPSRLHENRGVGQATAWGGGPRASFRDGEPEPRFSGRRRGLPKRMGRGDLAIHE